MKKTKSDNLEIPQPFDWTFSAEEKTKFKVGVWLEAGC